MTKPTAKYIWLDLETTGLDPAADIVLELAAWVGRPNFVLVGNEPQVERVMSCAPTRRARAHEVVREMHDKNGLWVEADRSQVLRSDVDRMLVDLVDQYEWSEGKPILAGSSVHFDRSFLRLDFPRFDRLLHYRHFDVSTLKMACRDIHPDVVFEGESDHRAAADILASVRHGERAVALLRGAGA